MRKKILACAVALASMAIAEPAVAQSSQASECTSVGIPVGVEVSGYEPIVAGRDGQLATYADEPFFLESGPQLADIKPPALRCTAVRGVVGFAVDPEGSVFLANGHTVSLISRRAVVVKRSFSPKLGPGQSITAIALLPSGQIELVLSGPSTVFAVYSRAAQGAAINSLRSFHDDALLGVVTAITIDSRGRTYAYDDAGEIAEFSRDATGAVRPLLTIGGAASGLRRASAAPHGSRQLALDDIGNLYAIDDGSLVQFESASDDAIPPDDGHARSSTTIGGAHDGIARVAGVATDLGGNIDVLSVGADEKVTMLVFLRRFSDGKMLWDRTLPIPVP